MNRTREAKKRSDKRKLPANTMKMRRPLINMNDKKVNRRQFLTTGAAAAAGAATIVGAPAVIANPTRQITWRMQTHWPAGSWYYEPLFQRYADRIKEATDGELIIETHQPGSIVSTGDVLRGVRRGTL